MYNESATMNDTPSPPAESQVMDTAQFKADLAELIPHLRAFAKSLCDNPTLADDVAQDTLLKAWRNREAYQPGTNLKAWTFTILRNQFYSLKRRSWRSTSLEPEVAEAVIVSPEDLDNTLELNDIRHALKTLSVEHREAIILVGASGMSYEEAAEVCGVATGTIKSRVNRARKHLAATLKEGKFDRKDDGVRAADAFDSILGEADRLTK